MFFVAVHFSSKLYRLATTIRMKYRHDSVFLRTEYASKILKDLRKKVNTGIPCLKSYNMTCFELVPKMFRKTKIAPCELDSECKKNEI